MPFHLVYFLLRNISLTLHFIIFHYFSTSINLNNKFKHPQPKFSKCKDKDKNRTENKKLTNSTAVISSL